MKRKLMAVLLSIAMLTATITPVMGTVASEFTEPTPAPVAETAAPTAEAAPVETPASEESKTDEATNAPSEAPSAVPTEEASAEPSVEPSEEATVEPSVEPSEEATVEPSVDPSEEATVEPSVDPSEEATVEPSVEPSEEPTIEPSVDPSEEPTVEPSIDPSEEPTVEPSVEPSEALAATVKASQRSSFAGDYAGATAKISGGVAPYAVQTLILCEGELVYESSVTLETAGEVSFGAKVERTGTAVMKVVVMDAQGAIVEDSTSSPVASAERETRASWERTMKDVELTGDWREDLIAIAISQLGYQESATNFIVREDGSVQGYTRYGDWYGMPYEEWCAMFVSFCMEYAKIPEGNFPHAANCTRWIEKLIYFGAYEDAKDYEPQPGDLVFFNWEKEEDREPYESDHVGIVERVTDSTIYTIEGNSGLKVRRCEYARNDWQIIGYANTEKLMRAAGLFDEEETTDAPETDVPADDMVEVYDIPLGTIGKTNTDLVNVRAATSTEADILGTVPTAGTQFELTGAEMNAAGELWYKVVYEESTGYMLSDFVDVQDQPKTLELTDSDSIETAAAKIAAMASTWNGDAAQLLTLGVDVVNFGADASVQYIWQMSMDGESWSDLTAENQNVAELTDGGRTMKLCSSAETLTELYRCVVTVNSAEKYASNTVMFLNDQVRKSLEGGEVEEITLELLQRVYKAGGINNLYAEDGGLYFAKDGKLVATIASRGEKRYVIDTKTGLVVAVFTEDGKIVPLVPANQEN